MKKFMNDPARMATESLVGFVAAHGDLVEFGPNQKFVRRKTLSPGKVGIISGGGAGHEPLHVGFVGRGMLDAACPGQFFTSPTPDQIAAAIESVDQGAGVLLIVKNYDGDVMNFEMAAEIAGARGIDLATLIIGDDAAATGGNRRGIAGTLFAQKILGAAAEQGMSLERLAGLGKRAVSGMRTLGVSLKGAVLPTATRETFQLADGDIEFGVGIHGEPGSARIAMRSADDIVELMCIRLLEDLGATGGRVLLFVNGLGATPQSELYLVYGLAETFLAARGFTIERSLVGSFVTSLDMAGLSITVALLDPELERLWDFPVHTAALRW